MKKAVQNLWTGMLTICAILVFESGFAQIDYSEDFAAGSHGWTNTSFEATTVAPCEGAGALRARINNLLVVELPATTVSPNLGVSNGEEVTLTYRYRLLNYDPVLPIIPVDLLDFGALTLQYAPTAAGPWIDLDNITVANYTSTADCTERIVSFTPPADTNVYLRFRANLGVALDLDYYVYLDEINVTQGLLSALHVQKIDGITAYPNPVENYLNIEYDGVISNVAVFNMQGQEVSIDVPDTDFSRLDMTGLANGAYIVKVDGGTGIKTLNIVKD